MCDEEKAHPCTLDVVKSELFISRVDGCSSCMDLVCVMGCMRGELHGVCMLVLGLLTYSSGAIHTSHLGPEMTGRYVIAPFLVISDSEL